MMSDDMKMVRQKWPRAWCRRKRRGNKQTVFFEILSNQAYTTKVLGYSKIDAADAWKKLAIPIYESIIALLEQ